MNPKREKNKAKGKVLDLYCGVGGFSLGAARAGFEIVGAIDNDAIVLETHSRNFPKAKHLSLDLSRVAAKDIMKMLELEPFELCGVIGGPPCQGFSTIGKNDKTDRRNQLFVGFFRLVNELKPAFFICENVPGIVRDQFKGIREAAMGCVKENYDLLEPLVLKASDYGAPTSRTRVFFVGFLKDSQVDLTPSEFEPSKYVRRTLVGDALKGLPRKVGLDDLSYWRKIKVASSGQFGNRLSGLIPRGVGEKATINKLRVHRIVSGFTGTAHTSEVSKRWKLLGLGEIDEVSRTSRLDPKGFCPTLRAGTSKERGSYQSLRPIHPYEDRVITPREAARLQGFPDWYVFHRTKWHSFRQIGNSVCPIVAEWILRVIREEM